MHPRSPGNIEKRVKTQRGGEILRQESNQIRGNVDNSWQPGRCYRIHGQKSVKLMPSATWSRSNASTHRWDVSPGQKSIKSIGSRKKNASPGSLKQLVPLSLDQKSVKSTTNFRFRSRINPSRPKCRLQPAQWECSMASARPGPRIWTPFWVVW